MVYFVFFPTSSPKPFKLRSTATTSSPTGANGSGTSSSAVAGKWTVAKGSAAGYRVREKLAFLPAQSDAVGRTSQISGSAEFSELTSPIAMEDLEIKRHPHTKEKTFAGSLSWHCASVEHVDAATTDAAKGLLKGLTPVH